MADSLVIDLPDGVYEDAPGWSGMIRHSDMIALTAGAYPVQPPSAWFENPSLKGLTPLTIDDNGRVFGHIAAWHTSHIGMAGGVKPPRSKSNYAYYRTGVVKCDDGKFVDVGQITLTGGHAPLSAGVAKAVAHYDDTASAIMDVAAGEDKHGIWVAGALRPEVTDAQLRSIRASSVSGDWRPINGKLELVAVCAVNAPGFPIPRARVASGAPIALVAAGIEPLIEIAMNDRLESNVEEGIKAGLELFRERILRLENVVLAGGSQEPAKPSVDADQLRKRVRGGSALAASLRERVRGGHTPEVVADVEALAASLRERVKGSDAGPKGTAPEALTAAQKKWDPLLHPRGADGKFIEVDSWVRWLRRGFGSTRRGQVVEIVPVQKGGVTERVVARVEFPEPDGSKSTHDVPFDELERVAPPKGELDGGQTDDQSDSTIAEKIAEEAADNISESSAGDQTAVQDAVEEAVKDVVDEAVPDTPEDKANPTDLQLEAGEIQDSSVGVSDWRETSQWAEAVRKMRENYENWRSTQLERNAQASDVTLTAYLDWIAEQGMNASLVAGLRAEARVRGESAILAHATSYWTEERRQDAAKQGHALEDGSYPIGDVADLKKAIQAYGRAKHPEKTKQHIIKRARALKKTDLLPEGWTSSKSRTASGFSPAKPALGDDGEYTFSSEQGDTSPAGAEDEIGRLRDRVHGAD